MAEQTRSRPLPPLWREVLGARLRRMRQRRRLTLTDTAARAGISPQYLSEVERGRKDPSSEMIAAVVGALGADLAQLLDLTARDLRTRGGVTHLDLARTARSARGDHSARGDRASRGPVVALRAAA